MESTARRQATARAAAVEAAGDGAGHGAPARPTALAAGRAMVVIFLIAGFMTMTTALVPSAPGFRSHWVVGIGIMTMASGAMAHLVPWGRLPLRSTLVVLPFAFALIGVHNYLGGADPYRHGVYLVVVFAWVGTFHSRRTSLWLLPMAAAAYLAPLVVSGAPAYSLWSAAYALPLFVLVGETLAWRSAGVAALQADLRRLASTDQLTGLANRAVFTDRLAESVARDEDVAVIFLVLDGFKQVNDRFGHAAGDDVLVATAAAIQRAERSGDLAVRLAGDEFAVVVHDVPDAVALAHRVVDEVARVPRPDGHPVALSAGVAVHRPGETADALVVRADQAMYEAKRTGHGLVRVGA